MGILTRFHRIFGPSLLRGVFYWSPFFYQVAGDQQYRMQGGGYAAPIEVPEFCICLVDEELRQQVQE